MLHGPKYTAPAFVRLFKGKHHAVTSKSEMEDPTSREGIMCWIACYIATEKEEVAWVSDPHVPITKGVPHLSGQGLVVNSSSTFATYNK